MPEPTYRITGRVRDVRHEHRPAPGLRVEAWDLDFFRDDLLATTVTDADGSFALEIDPKLGRELFMDREPDLYFKVFDGEQLLLNTEEAVHWNLEPGERHLELEIGREPAESAHARLGLAVEQTERLLDRLLVVLDRCIQRIPPDRLDFRPTPQNMTAREIAHHVYETVLMTYRGTELGRLDKEDLAFLAFDVASARHPEDITAWGARVKEYVRGLLPGLTRNHLDRPVKYYLGMTLTGWESLRMAMEETLHHRGQLMLYLRLMGVAPPRTNDFS